MAGNDLNDVIESPLPLAPIVGRRRTRATAQLHLMERREHFKRRRERAAQLEQAARNNSTATSSDSAITHDHHNNSNNSHMAPDNAENIHANTSTPPRTSRQSGLQDTRSTLDTTHAAAREMASPTVKIVVGASFGDKIGATSVIERTPTKRELQSPPQIRRMKPAPQATVPTPEKAVPASAGLEEVGSAASSGNTIPAAAPTTTAAEALMASAATASGASDSAAFPSESAMVPDKDVPVLKPKRVAARGIAQSGSSFSTRKRMISFSPERDERPENRALALLKLEKNLKATAKLQQRLEGVGVLSRNEEPRSAFTTPLKDRAAGAPVLTARMLQSPLATYTTPVKHTTTTPGAFETPSAPTNITLEFPSDDENDGEDHDGQDGTARDQTQRRNSVVTPVKRAPVVPASSQDATCQASQDAIDGEEQRIHGDPDDDNDDDDDLECCATQVLCSQVSEAESLAPPLSCSQEPSQLSQSQRVEDFGSSSSMAFTSTSVIEDVGLFNCEFDVEYTGGVYGEGTDGKVSAAVINGQKVALKRAKPHEGFPEDEAKRRSAVELHYLRRVRHMQGFVQCLGLCDAIDHTCIALEVMDCKLSDYLRRYGTNTSSSRASASSSSGSKRRFILALDDAKSLLKQIALPMMLLHDQVNVAHGDLACRNILLRTPPKGYEQKWEPVVKLSDFGRIRVPSTEPKILDERFSFFKNCDVGAFGREILYRFLVGEIVPPSCLETRSLHKQLQDVVVTQVPDAAKDRLGPYYRLFMRCTGWGVRPTFREIYDHLDDLEYFETTENGLFPLKPSGSAAADASFLSPVLDSSRPTKAVSSGGGGGGSKGGGGKYDTPNGAQQRTSNGAARLLQSKSGTTDGSVATAHASHHKTVNLLKPRSVLRGTPHKVANPSAGAADKLHPRSLATSSGFTPNGRPMLLKKTPPSAGASRRSLQILSQIQHRTTGGGADKAK